MEAVIFDGKEYLKASVVAERFSYTQDYVGQLCRGKKVDARLVGRAWYINLDSLHSHKKARYKTQDKAPAQATEVPTTVATHSPAAPKSNYLSRIDVEPVLKRKTVKIIKNQAGKLNEFAVKYENDDYSLIPKISREAVHKSLPVLPAGATDMHVDTAKDSLRVTSFKAEPLPEVYLKGILKIEGIKEVIEELPPAENTSEPTEASENITESSVSEVKKPHFATTTTTEPRPVDIKKPLKVKLYRNSTNHKTIPAENIVPRVVVSEIPAKRMPAQLLRPREVSARREIVVEKVVETQNTPVTNAAKSKNTPNKQVSIPFATVKSVAIFLVGVGLAVSLLAAEVELTLHGNSATTSWTFSSEKISDVAALVTVF